MHNVASIFDRKLSDMEAVTQRLGLKHWHWMTDVDLADKPAPAGSLRLGMPYVWGWMKDGSGITDVEDFIANVEAETVGEAVAKLEQVLIDRMAAKGAAVREDWIEDIQFQANGLAVLRRSGAD